MSPGVSPRNEDKDAAGTPLERLRCVFCFSLVLMFLLFGFLVENFLRGCGRQRPTLGKTGRLELGAQHRQRRAHKKDGSEAAKQGSHKLVRFSRGRPSGVGGVDGCKIPGQVSLTNSLDRYSRLNTTLRAYQGGAQTRHTVFLYEACGLAVTMM